MRRSRQSRKDAGCANNRFVNRPGPDSEPEDIPPWQQVLILGYVIAFFGGIVYLWVRFGLLIAFGAGAVFTVAVLVGNRFIWEPWRLERRERLVASGRLDLSTKPRKRTRRRIPVLSSVYDFLASPPPPWLDRILQTNCQANSLFLIVSLITVIVLIHTIIH